jgi:hypothetical protein
MVPLTMPFHGLAPEVILMIRVEIGVALTALQGLLTTGDARRISAVIVLLEEVEPEFAGDGRKPWRAVPWLDCALHLLQQIGSPGASAVREHVGAARDLLQRE